ncbi:MAG: hypothetical protein IAF38_02280 [Bacteroidia bacterium]|nr:hypothetical protein [Bacteroidia bacterium]
MKKLMLAVALLVAGASVEAKIEYAVKPNVTVGEVKWEKSATGTWLGKDKTWYKLNTADASIWWSKDGKKWEAVKDGMWQDKDGKWLKIGDKKLWWSKDGKEWAEVPEWKWEGYDSVWNKFDKDWSLWTAKK